MTLNNKNNIIDGGFLQSEHWKEFQKVLGREVYVIENDQGKALMLEYQLPIVGSYFFVPRGPIIMSGAADELVREIIDKAKQRQVGWIRVEPQSKQDLKLIQEAAKNYKLAVIKARKDHEPTQTLMLDLAKGEEEILKGMKQKTRYNIRLAEKRGVEVFASREDQDVERFCDLVEETAKRDKVVAHPRSYYQKMLRAVPDEALKLYQAKYNDRIIAGAIISFSGEVATYQHGASANKQRNVMAPYLLQWVAIKDAKSKGYTKYDFGGAKIKEQENEAYSQKKNPDNKQPDANYQPQDTSWLGITKFKLGFCPTGGAVNFPGCYDIIISRKKYYLYRLIQKLKDTLRKFR